MKRAKSIFLWCGELVEQWRGWLPYWGFCSKNVRTSSKKHRNIVLARGSMKELFKGSFLLESIDELLRHGVQIPVLDKFENIILFTETSEEISSSNYVRRVYRALGERGILERVKGILVGRPKSWIFDKQNSAEEKARYKKGQRDEVLRVVRQYNSTIPVIQNMDFGHTDPQICRPYGKKIKITSSEKKIFAEF